MASVPKHNFTRIATSAALKATPCVVYGLILTPGSANATMKLTNDADGSGDAVIALSAIANGQSVFIDAEIIGPINFSSKCYATIAGTGAQLFVWHS